MLKLTLILSILAIFIASLPNPKNTVYPPSNAQSWKNAPFSATSSAQDIYSKIYGVAETHSLTKYRSVVKDPFGGDDYVIKVVYEKGGYASKGPGGQAMYARPPIAYSKAKTIKFCYDIAFDANFDFGAPTKIGNIGIGEGKTPGLFSGDTTNCEVPSKCFSMRYMWRADGVGEIFPTVVSKADRPPGWCPDEKKCGNGSGGQGKQEKIKKNYIKKKKINISFNNRKGILFI
ncbi:hypothetical protein HDU92_007375 [Lobulomyces angularis]|nr:hypothetical protein HDU92_007375 [Lobulomyces angularis]